MVNVKEAQIVTMEIFVNLENVFLFLNLAISECHMKLVEEKSTVFIAILMLLLDTELNMHQSIRLHYTQFLHTKMEHIYIKKEQKEYASQAG